MASPDVLQLAHNLALGVQEVQWLNYALVPSITLMIFDWLLTLDMEVSLVWNSPRSGAKLLYLLTRYLPFIDIPITFYYQFGYALPLHACKVSYQIFTWMFVVGQCFAVAILTMRTWAVCGKSKLSTYGLFSVYGISITSIIVLFALYSRRSTFEASSSPQLFGCIANTNLGSSYIASIYVILMFYDGGLLLVMIVQGLYAYAFREAGKSELTRVVFRDGILYYVYIFGLSLVNTVVIFRLHDAYKTMLVNMERVTYSILACRVVLHIREQGEMEKLGLLPSEQITGPLRFAHATQRTGLNMTGINDDEYYSRP